MEGDGRDLEVAVVVLEDLLPVGRTGMLVSRQRLEGIAAACHVELVEVTLAAGVAHEASEVAAIPGSDMLVLDRTGV